MHGQTRIYFVYHPKPYTSAALFYCVILPPAPQALLTLLNFIKFPKVTMPFIITDSYSPVLQRHTSVCGNFTAILRHEGWVIFCGDQDVTSDITSHIEDKYTLLATIGTQPVEFFWGQPTDGEVHDQPCLHCNTDPCFIYEVMQSVGVHETIWRSQEPLITQSEMNKRRKNLAIRILHSRDLIASRVLPRCVDVYLTTSDNSV